MSYESDSIGQHIRAQQVDAGEAYTAAREAGHDDGKARGLIGLVISAEHTLAGAAHHLLDDIRGVGAAQDEVPGDSSWQQVPVPKPPVEQGTGKQAPASPPTAEVEDQGEHYTTTSDDHGGGTPDGAVDVKTQTVPG